MSSALAIALANAHAAKRLPAHQRINFQGIPITIENTKGTIRRGIDDDGKPWANRMAAHYGYICHTEDTDGDGVDVFVGPKANSDKVFIVDQLRRKKHNFDEHKCLSSGLGSGGAAPNTIDRAIGGIFNDFQL